MTNSTSTFQAPKLQTPEQRAEKQQAISRISRRISSVLTDMQERLAEVAPELTTELREVGSVEQLFITNEAGHGSRLSVTVSTSIRRTSISLLSGHATGKTIATFYALDASYSADTVGMIAMGARSVELQQIKAVQAPKFA